jgi:hypothetical protein
MNRSILTRRTTFTIARNIGEDLRNAELNFKGGIKYGR